MSEPAPDSAPAPDGGQTHKKLLVGGLLLLLAGLVMGLWPVSASMDGDAVPCGTAWAPSYELADAVQRGEQLGTDLIGLGLEYKGDRRQDCRDAIGSLGTFAAIVAGLGVVSLIGLAVVRGTASRPPNATA